MPITGRAQPFNREQPKKIRKPRFAHVDNTKYGMGDNYGRGVKAPIGRVRSTTVGINPASPKKLRKAPKSLA